MSLATKFRPFTGNKTNGILTYMSNATGVVDLDEGKIIKITASSIENERYFSNLFTGLGYFATNREPNSWIMFDFKQSKISISSYTIRCYTRDLLKEWAIYGSDDNKRWNSIDHKFNSIDINTFGDKLTEFYFETEHPITRRYIKLQALQQRLANDDILIIHKIEFFGTFYNSKDIIKNSCNIANRKKPLQFSSFNF